MDACDMTDPQPRAAAPGAAATGGARLRPDGLVVQAPAWVHPGLRHGVTTRRALPTPGKDEFFNAIRRAREVGAIPYALTIGADQVHGDHIEVFSEPLAAGRHPAGLRCDPDRELCEYPATDALLTTLPGVLLVIQTADCLPVFLVDRANLVAGLAHCGWRGLRQNLAGKLVRAAIDHGADPETLEAWLGPCIRAGQYEVSPELVEEFRAAFPGAPVSPAERHLDLPAIARWQLERAGLEEGRIIDSGECTRTRTDRYHSYRADGAQSGRILSYLGFPGATLPLRA